MLYAELHCKTNFTFLEGASHPDELVRRAAELQYAALAVTDRNSLAGVVRAHGAAKDASVKLIVGAEITPDDAPPVVLWATDRASYGRLARLITLGRRRAQKGQCRLSFDDLAQHAEGLLAGVREVESGEWRAEIASFPRSAWERTACDAPRRVGEARDWSASRRGASMHWVPTRSVGTRMVFPLPSPLSSLPSPPTAICSPIAAISWPSCTAGRTIGGNCNGCGKSRGRPGFRWWRPATCIITLPERAALHDVLTAVRHGSTVAEATRHLFPNAERHLKSPAEMAAAFAECPRRWCARWKSPSAARFRSTRFATSIPRSWPRRA